MEDFDQFKLSFLLKFVFERGGGERGEKKKRKEKKPRAFVQCFFGGRRSNVQSENSVSLLAGNILGFTVYGFYGGEIVM